MTTTTEIQTATATAALAAPTAPAPTPARQTAASIDFVRSVVDKYGVDVLNLLLADKTTGANITWADNEYDTLGEGYHGKDEITAAKITGEHYGIIKPRIAKEKEQQSFRTRNRAEVFTPSWLCNMMNNHFDEEWFGRKDVFNAAANQRWVAHPEPVAFPQAQERAWKAYVTATRLEITCGEAPFICSRYDTVSGEFLPVEARIGFLDRKLRVVSENTKTRANWMHWALEALRSAYGFEYQGDNVVVARINVLESFAEHYYTQWKKPLSSEEIAQAADIIAWNIWQMDGLTLARPAANGVQTVMPAQYEFKDPAALGAQESFFDLLFCEEEVEVKPLETTPYCVIYDWELNQPRLFKFLQSEANGEMGKLFYAVIGNPPYQEDVEGNQRKAPIYNHFLDGAFAISEKTEMITPARFLFNAGQTPKEWNKKMLADPHLKVLFFTPDGETVFPGVDLKGGVAITYRDGSVTYGAINTYVAFEELRSILEKVREKSSAYVDGIVTGAVPYAFTEDLKKEHPECVELIGSSFDLRTNCFDKLQDMLFFESKPADDDEYCQIVGLRNTNRVYRWIKRKYITVPANYDKYKVLLPESNGSGAIGEVLSTPLIGQPLIGHTQTFISLGSFDSESEAVAAFKYVKTKFARCLLGVLKVTQHNPRNTWKYVPLQDFTSMSDIDWSQSISDIDKQLYAKYGLSAEEIEFIETHVKEMS